MNETIQLKDIEQKVISQCIKNYNMETNIDVTQPIDKDTFSLTINILIRKALAFSKRDEVALIEHDALVNLKNSYVHDNLDLDVYTSKTATPTDTSIPKRKINPGSKY